MFQSEKNRAVQLRCLELLLRPIIRFSLRNLQSLQDFTEVTKKVFVDIAEQEIVRSSKKVNTSRLSVMTGMSRRDVMRIHSQDIGADDKAPSILARVLGQWEQDKRFTTQTGSPRVLTFKGEDSEFQELVFSVSKHLNPGTVLFELERIGATKKTPRGLKLIKANHMLAADPTQSFEMLSNDIDSLITVVNENLTKQKQGIKYPHLRTEYDNIYEKDLPKIREWMYEEGKDFHKRARDFIAQFDKDVITLPKDKDGSEPKAGARVILSAFGHTKATEKN